MSTVTEPLRFMEVQNQNIFCTVNFPGYDDPRFLSVPQFIEVQYKCMSLRFDWRDQFFGKFLQKDFMK